MSFGTKVVFFYKERLTAFQYWPHLIAVFMIALAIFAYRFFAYHFTYSNDAYVSANVINMASLVSGPISKIYVSENQKVLKGEKLIEIDQRPYKYAMDKAKAEHNIAKLDYENGRFAIVAASERLKQNQDYLNLSKDHLTRYKKLQVRGDIADIQLVDTEAKLKEQEAGVVSARQALKIAQKNFDNNRVLAAKAAYKNAKYLYEHTLVRAPVDGFITNFNLRRGQYIKRGEGLFALIETSHWWVLTRYRETAIRLIHPGDKARITIDMYPGKVFHGHVHSIGWGINRVQAGAVVPSTLAYLEATEDWIKIAQRFPVRIYIDDLSSDYPMRIGASAATKTYR